MRITHLNIYTSKIKEQINFYENILSAEVIDENLNSVTIKIGHTNLTLTYNKDAKPYHFAINIPSNKAEEALTWLKRKTNVLKFHDQEIVDFPAWNAKSIYFYDADKNIVELIARKNLKIEMNEPFSSTQFLSISEIGMSVNNVSQIFEQINEIQQTPLYFGNLEWFCAAGDEQGLFIIIDQDKKGWMPCNDYAYTSDFEIKGDLNFKFINGKIV